jgi:hypothetical protein
MTITEKYGFKVSVDQFGKTVSPYHFDCGETGPIELFEKEVNELKLENKPMSSMLELGSANAYYSLLFKHIIGKDRSFNIMVEPIPWRCRLGMKDFELNNCKGMFYNCGVGKDWHWNGKTFKVPTVTLKSILRDTKLSEIDFLHCDIDGSELQMLQDNKEIFELGKVRWAFIYTHESLIRKGFHNECKQFFDGLNYDLKHEWNCVRRMTDDLLVYRRCE